MTWFCVLLSSVLLIQAHYADAVLRVTGNQVSLKGDNPALLHLRIATDDGTGVLRTAHAILISTSWAVTTATAVDGARFIWIRYGTEEVAQPELVTESSLITVHPDFDGVNNNIAVININRIVHYTENIQNIPIARLADEDDVHAYACGWGLGSNEETELPEVARCIWLEAQNKTNCGIDEYNDFFTCTIGQEGAQDSTGKFDDGTPLIRADWVGNPYAIGLLAQAPANPGQDSHSGLFVRPSRYVSWINSVTGLRLTTIFLF